MFEVSSMNYYSTLVYINNTSSRDKTEFPKMTTHKVGLLKPKKKLLVDLFEVQNKYLNHVDIPLLLNLNLKC